MSDEKFNSVGELLEYVFLNLNLENINKKELKDFLISIYQRGSLHTRFMVLMIIDGKDLTEAYQALVEIKNEGFSSKPIDVFLDLIIKRFEKSFNKAA